MDDKSEKKSKLHGLFCLFLNFMIKWEKKTHKFMILLVNKPILKYFYRL